MVREYGRSGIIQAIGGYLGGYILLQIIILGLYSWYMRSQSIVITNDMFMELTIFSTFISGFATAGVYVYFFQRILMYDFLRFTKTFASLRLVLIGFAGLYGVNVLIGLLYQWFNIEGVSLNQELVQSLLLQQPLFMALPIVLFIPFVEEVLFRGAMFELLTQKLPVAGSVVIVNLVFAMLHVSDIASFVFFPVYFLLGVVLSLVYLKSGKNIWVSIAAHSLHNVLSVVAILITLS